MIINLYYLFYNLKYTKGIQYLERILAEYIKSIEHRIKRLSRNHIYGLNLMVKTDKYTLRDIRKIIFDIKNNNHYGFFCPINISSNKNGKEYVIEAQYNKDTFIPCKDLMNIYYANKESKLQDELDNLSLILDETV